MSDSAIPWTVVHQAPLSVGFPRQEYWSELPVSPPEDIPDPGIEPTSPVSPALAGGFFTLPILSYCLYLQQNNTAATAKSLQSCLTLCDPIDGSPPGSPVPRILQARTLEWVAISFSNASKWKVKVKSLSRIQPLATPWTTAYQAPPPISRQEYWSGVPLPSPNKTIHDSIKYFCLFWVFSVLKCIFV